MTPEPRYAVPHTRRIAPSTRQASATSVTARVAAARPIQPLRASSVDAASQSVPGLPLREVPGRQKAKQVEQHEDEDPEAKCQRGRIHELPARRPFAHGRRVR